SSTTEKMEDFTNTGGSTGAVSFGGEGGTAGSWLTGTGLLLGESNAAESGSTGGCGSGVRRRGATGCGGGCGSAATVTRSICGRWNSSCVTAAGGAVAATTGAGRAIGGATTAGSGLATMDGMISQAICWAVTELSR